MLFSNTYYLRAYVLHDGLLLLNSNVLTCFSLFQIVFILGSNMSNGSSWIQLEEYGIKTSELVIKNHPCFLRTLFFSYSIAKTFNNFLHIGLLTFSYYNSQYSQSERNVASHIPNLESIIKILTIIIIWITAQLRRICKTT